MCPHDLPLAGVERTWLRKDPVRDRDLPDVVQPAAEVAALDRVGGEPEPVGPMSA